MTKAWVNPFEKCDVWDFERVKFLWPKRVSFLSSRLLNIISSLIFRENKKKEKNYIFWPKAWVNPFGKMLFLGIERLKFLWPKKVSFLSRTLLNIISSLILTENIKRNNTFFDQKHGLTSLEKCDFWDFESSKLLWPKKVSFLSRTLLNIIFSLILRENK